MKALMAVLVIAISSLAARSEELRCPQEGPVAHAKSPGEWQREFRGFLEKVTLIRSNEKPERPVNSVITCYRSVGVASIEIAKACKIVAGSAGRIETLHKDNQGEVLLCTFKGLMFERDNNRGCIIICE